jgi:hypothetical protein
VTAQALSLAPAAADRAVLDRVLAGSGVETAPAPPDSSYIGELFGAAQQALLDALLAGGRMLNLPRPVVYGIVIVLLGLAVLLLLRLVLARVRAGASKDQEAGTVAAGDGPAPSPRDAAGWRAELERRLAEGRIPEALEAAWWWLARSVAGDKAEPDWTSRDLLARTRRRELVPLVRRLDAFIYGPRQPQAEELRALVGRMEETLS